MSEADKKVILTCTQPSGQLHLGNYFGAIRNWADMLDPYECFFGIVDQHAITKLGSVVEPQDGTPNWRGYWAACVQSGNLSV